MPRVGGDMGEMIPHILLATCSERNLAAFSQLHMCINSDPIFCSSFSLYKLYVYYCHKGPQENMQEDAFVVLFVEAESQTKSGYLALV